LKVTDDAGATLDDYELIIVPTTSISREAPHRLAQEPGSRQCFSCSVAGVVAVTASRVEAGHAV
jgi:hypothetical protein